MQNLKFKKGFVAFSLIFTLWLIGNSGGAGLVKATKPLPPVETELTIEGAKLYKRAYVKGEWASLFITTPKELVISSRLKNLESILREVQMVMHGLSPIFVGRIVVY